ncbi:MAG: hypothetical protein L0322_25325 [Chloroflexi bacterium]|nr:hypothetical protein [Chloroflexota bacterium]MCI0644952.1 hypothetical protein [Chloroflexota bacterium]
MSNDNDGLKIKRIGKRRWALIFNGRTLDEMSYEQARPIILGHVDKRALLAGYGVELAAGQGAGNG